MTFFVTFFYISNYLGFYYILFLFVYKLIGCIDLSIDNKQIELNK